HIPLPKYHFTEGIMSFPEYKTLCDYLKEYNLRYYFIVRFLGSTGARISELVKFTIQDLEKGYAECHSKGKFRRINIPQSLINESREFFKIIKKNYS
ncbi:tyrosine-type recombinase/integrase, partial [Glaesserella parasuis]|nr:tyrosine-type recombinase/integrase [Glaesserella parasuis]MDE4022496.1 tyrosine-type recombinase/integrase [Glaesserella parasuis]